MTTARPGESESDLRHRTTTKSTQNTPTPQSTTPSTPPRSSRNTLLTPLDALRALAGLLLLTTLSSYLLTRGTSYTFHLTTHPPWFLSSRGLSSYFSGPLLLTPAQLASYDGSHPGSPIYLALNRSIYDVSASPHVYGLGGMYSVLAAKDASRSYITTCFDPAEDLVPWLQGVEEVYVPLWLSRAPGQDELDALVKEVPGGKSGEELVEEVRKRVGKQKVRVMQEEAYEKARERVRAQVKTWEGMFERKAYPVVGRVVGVDEEGGGWKGLGFCEAARKQRPGMAESLAEAVKGFEAKGGGVTGAEGKGKAQKAKQRSEDEAKVKGKGKKQAIEDVKLKKGGKVKGKKPI